MIEKFLPWLLGALGITVLTQPELLQLVQDFVEQLVAVLTGQ